MSHPRFGSGLGLNNKALDMNEVVCFNTSTYYAYMSNRIDSVRPTSTFDNFQPQNEDQEKV